MRQEPPVKVNDELTLRCIGVGKKGDGVFKTEKGYVIIAECAELDKTYRLRVTRAMLKMGFAEIVGDAA